MKEMKGGQQLSFELLQVDDSTQVRESETHEFSQPISFEEFRANKTRQKLVDELKMSGLLSLNSAAE